MPVPKAREDASPPGWAQLRRPAITPAERSGLGANQELAEALSLGRKVEAER